MIYSVRSQSKEVVDATTKIVANITIDPSHPIFEGHFPNQPILPGVCMMQIVRELITSGLGKSVSLVTASNVKFLAVLSPLEHPNVSVEIFVSVDGQGLKTTSRIYSGDLTFFKMQAVFQASLFKLPGAMSS